MSVGTIFYGKLRLSQLYLGYNSGQISTDTTQYSNITLIGANCIPNSTQANSPNGQLVSGTSTAPTFVPYGFDYLPLNASGTMVLGNMKENTVCLVASLNGGDIALSLVTYSGGASQSYVVFSTAVTTS